jgi:hypothetical protein
MKLLKCLACVVVVVLSGCEGATPDVETSASPLTSAQVFQAPQSAPGFFATATYACSDTGVTYYVRQGIAQAFTAGLHGGSTRLMEWAPGSIDYGRAEVELRCPQVYTLDHGTWLGNIQAMDCEFWSHLPGWGWAFQAHMHVNVDGMSYAPKGSYGLPNGLWAVELYSELPGSTCFHGYRLQYVY